MPYYAYHFTDGWETRSHGQVYDPTSEKRICVEAPDKETACTRIRAIGKFRFPLLFSGYRDIVPLSANEDDIQSAEDWGTLKPHLMANGLLPAATT
jgi:hypothetical protein